MKIRFKKFVLVEIEDRRWLDIQDKAFYKWDELDDVESIEEFATTAHIYRKDDTIGNVPLDAFERI